MEEKIRERLYGTSQQPTQRQVMPRYPAMPPSGGYAPSSIEKEKTREID